MKKTLIFIISCLITFSLLIGIPFSVTAASTQGIPYDTYTYVNTADGREAILSKTVYKTEKIIDGLSIGTNEFKEIRDMFITDDNEIFVLDGVEGQVTVLNSDFSLKTVISSFMINGESTSLKEPQGIFVDKKNTMWIADTENKRILHTDLTGNVLETIGTPSGELIPKDFDYFPMKVACDSKGYVYVICRGSYYGALIFDTDGNFVSFFGANKVKSSFISGMQRIFQRMFVSNEKLAISVQKLPYQFLDFEVDKEDFVYTVSSSETGQVRKLGPNGNNSLYNGSTNSDSYNFGDEQLYTNDIGITTEQNLTAIDVDLNGNIFILDSNYCRVYVYDKNCKNICVFGGGFGKGIQEGTFLYPSSICCFKDGILVADKLGGNITYFTLTNYGKKILAAETLSNNGEYDKAVILWEEVLNEDSSCQIAYTYLSKAYYALGDYQAAMDNAKKGMDQELYAQAFKEVNEKFVSDNFVWIFIIIIVAVGVLITLVIISLKRNLIIIKNENIRLVFRVVFHPFDTFNEIKYKQKGSVLIATVLTLLFYVATILGKEYGGFMYSLPGKSGVDSFYTFISTFGIVLLFSIVNWAFSALFQGKGRLKEIYIATAYSLLPLTLYRFIFVFASHFVVPGEVGIMTYLSVICTVATVILLLIGQIVVNDYSLWKTLAIGLITVIGMVVIGLLVFVIVLLIQNILGFVVSVYNEAFLR